MPDSSAPASAASRCPSPVSTSQPSPPLRKAQPPVATTVAAARTVHRPPRWRRTPVAPATAPSPVTSSSSAGL